MERVIWVFRDIFTSNTTSGDLWITLSQEATLGTRSRNSDLVMPARQSLGSPNAFVTVILFEPVHFYYRPDNRCCQIVLSIYFFVIFPTSEKGKWRSPKSHVEYLWVTLVKMTDSRPEGCVFQPHAVDWHIYMLEQHLNNLQPWPSHIIG